MKKLLLYLSIMGYLLGCAPGMFSLAPDMVSNTTSQGRMSVDLAGLNKANIALMPLRSTFGTPTKNNTVKDQFSDQITRNFPNIKLVHSDKLNRWMFAKNRRGFREYRKLQEKYIARGMFSKDDLAVFGSAKIDYVISISLNSSTQSAYYPKPYLFLMSMQIWDVNTGRIVWDITQEGQVIVELEDENKSSRMALMRHMCDSVLAKLS